MLKQHAMTSVDLKLERERDHTYTVTPKVEYVFFLREREHLLLFDLHADEIV